MEALSESLIDGESAAHVKFGSGAGEFDASRWLSPHV
jgi:hypothetical protein